MALNQTFRILFRNTAGTATATFVATISVIVSGTDVYGCKCFFGPTSAATGKY